MAAIDDDARPPGTGPSRRVQALALLLSGVGVLGLVVAAVATVFGGASPPTGTAIGTDYVTVEASAYGGVFVGRETACGETLTDGARIVAHRTLACGTPLDLRLDGTTVSVTVGDRGPFVDGRELDLAPAVWSAFGYASIAAFGVRPLGVRLAE